MDVGAGARAASEAAAAADGGSFIFDSVEEEREGSGEARKANSRGERRQSERPSIDLTDSSRNSIFHLSRLSLSIFFPIQTAEEYVKK